MRAALGFALEDLLHDRSRSLLSIAGLAVVVASFIILTSLANALAGALSATSLSRNLLVIQNDVIDPSDAVLDAQALQAVQELVPEWASRASALVFRHTRVGGHVVQLRAADQADWQPVHRLELLQGAWPTRQGEVIAGEGLALANGWQVGMQVHIFGSPFRISGIFRSPGIAFASVWMPIEAFWVLFDRQRSYQAVVVQAAPGVDAEALLVRLQKDPRLAQQYAVYFEDSYTSRNIRALQDLSSLMSIASGVALLGIVFGVYNASSLSSVERSREIGILRGIGFARRTVQRFLWLRALVLALLAYIFGMGMATLFLAGQQAFSPLIVLGVPFVLRLTPGMWLAALLWVSGLSLLGAWLSTRGMFHQRVTELLCEA